MGGVLIVDVQGRAEVAVQPRFAAEPVLAIHAWVLPSITADLPRNNLPVGIKDRKYQHIFWRESPHDRLQDYVLNTVTYVINCAPFLALRVLQSIAFEDCDNFELVRHALKCQTYVDDICVGADSEIQALELQSNLISVLSKSGLELKKWATNTASILRVIPADCRGSGPLPFDTADAFSIKVLGIEWHHETDEFYCALRLDPAPVYTKRGISSLVAQIFDPLGLFAPATFLAKSIIQQTWHVKLSWDAPLPIDIQSR
ncbi:hypothetical protein QTP88_006772 [Uroleucon formosanum]